MVRFMLFVVFVFSFCTFLFSRKCVPSAENGAYIDVIKGGAVVGQVPLHSLKNESFLCIGA
jgi:hypothetical protein